MSEKSTIVKDGEQVVNWKLEMLYRFEIRYDETVSCSLDTFMFDGHEFDTKYAGYLIQFLKQKLTPQDHGQN
jgi:hypothetical protein